MQYTILADKLKENGVNAYVVRLQQIGRRSLYKKWPENRENCWSYLDIFSCVKIFFLFFFFAFKAEKYVRCDNQYETGADKGNIFGQPMLFECVGICVLSPAHESEMRSYLEYVLIVKYLSR